MADIAGGENGLALEVRDLNRVIVHQREIADAARGQILQRRRADPAKTDHRDMLGRQSHLARPADLRDHNVALKALKPSGVQAGASGWLWG